MKLVTVDALCLTISGKSERRVKVGDVIEIAFGNKTVKVRITSVQETIRKEDAKEMFEYSLRAIA